MREFPSRAATDQCAGNQAKSRRPAAACEIIHIPLPHASPGGAARRPVPQPRSNRYVRPPCQRPSPAKDVVVVHSSDLHLDHDYTARLHGGDGTAGLACVLAAAREVGADVVLLAGDTFDCHRLPHDLLDRAATVIAAAADAGRGVAGQPRPGGAGRGLSPWRVCRRRQISTCSASRTTKRSISRNSGSKSGGARTATMAT